MENPLNRTAGAPSQVWVPPSSSSVLNFATNTVNKSAYNDDRGFRADAQSQLSHNLPGRAQSIRTVVMPPRPASPKAEKDLLNKLNEVNAQVNNWLKNIEQKRDDEHQSSRRSKSVLLTNPSKEE